MEWYQVLLIILLTGIAMSVLFFLYLDKHIRW